MVLIFITKNIMKKKVIYLNAKTGKEVHYGEQISFKESGKFENGYSFYSETSLPVINATIPELIKKGILVQKEVEIEEEKQQNEEQHELTVDEKLNILVDAAYNLVKKFNPKKIYVNFLIELVNENLNGRETFDEGTDITSLLKV